MRTRVTRVLSVTSVILAGALGLAGCAGGSSGSSSASGGGGSSSCFLTGATASTAPSPSAAGGKVTISFMEAMSGGTLKSSLAHLVSEFEAANPNITVQLQESPDYTTLEQNERDAVSAKKAPTIGQVYEGWAADYANSGVIDQLDSYLNQTQPSPLSGLYTGVANDQKLCDNHYYMWPFNKSLYVNFYNQNMLQQAGQTAPTTWDQFATVAKAVSKNGVTGITIDPGGPTAGATGGMVWLEILAQAFGTPVYDADGNPEFNSPAAIKAMQYLADLKKSGALATGKSYPGEAALGAQKGLFDLSSVAGYSYEQQTVGNKFTLGTENLPAGPAGPANQMNGTNVVIFSSATDAQKAAAWKFMQFLTTAQSQAYWASNTGYLPVTPAALPLMTAFTSKNPWMTVAAGALRTASGTAAVPWADKSQGELGTALTDVLENNVTPTDALNKAQTNAVADQKAAQ
ncbi:MAG TPA: extracellular solute-binding protein [Pseudonocardiaceae bacterium]|jgi:ABC-type glycerol-3-phosphate transport system substrate-binding protein|nr:extracellular solute-binding protein [Pseudonocardiaceae bacterium]